MVRVDPSLPNSLSALARMLDRAPSGPTPLADRLNEIMQRIRQEHAQLSGRDQRVVLVIATDGLPTSAYSGQSTAHDKQLVVQALKRLGTEFSVYVVIRLATDDDDVVDFYNKVDEELELPLEVLDDFESEAREIRNVGNGWLTYSPLLHKIREGGTFVKLLDLLDERSLTAMELSVVAQLLLRGEGDAAWPRDAERFCATLAAAVDTAPLVYDPLARRMVPPINASKAAWVAVPAAVRVASLLRFGMAAVASSFAACSGEGAAVNLRGGEVHI